MNDKYQTVVLTLSDGSKAYYTGPAQIAEGGPVEVVDIKVTHPKPLPSGHVFDRMEEAKEGEE